MKCEIRSMENGHRIAIIQSIPPTTSLSTFVRIIETYIPQTKHFPYLFVNRLFDECGHELVHLKSHPVWRCPSIIFVSGTNKYRLHEQKNKYILDFWSDTSVVDQS